MTRRRRPGLWAIAALLLPVLVACPPGRGSGGGSPGPGALTVGEIPGGELAPFAEFFSQYVSVFGVHVVATSEVEEAKVLHAASVLAEYLDNDEDGAVDDPLVLQAMVDNRATLVMFDDFDALESSGLFESDLLDGFGLQDLQDQETRPEGSSQSGGFDATLEEVWHLVTDKGYGSAYRAVFGVEGDSDLVQATDRARGGHFEGVPAEYPDEAWYHYDDPTCDHPCQVTEYFYWAMTSILGAQDYPGRCEDIVHEWEPCSRALVEEVDPAIFQLLAGGGHVLPTRLPDGRYREADGR